MGTVRRISRSALAVGTGLCGLVGAVALASLVAFKCDGDAARRATFAGFETAHGIDLQGSVSATELFDGTVLLLGRTSERNGFGGWASEDAVVRYDPRTGTVSTTAPLPFVMGSLTATRLNDGRVLVVQGSVATLFDPGANSFIQTGSPVSPLHAATAVLLEDGRVLFAGALVADPRQPGPAEIYDPRTGRFREIAGMGEPALRPHGVAVRGGAIFVAGQRLERFDSATERFERVLIELPTSNPTMTLLGDGRVLLSGGYEGTPQLAASRDQSVGVPASRQLWILDPSTFALLSLGSMTEPRFMHTATDLRDGRVLISGGDADTHRDRTLNSAEVVDLRTGALLAAFSMVAPRSRHAALLLVDGRVLLAGSVSVLPAAPVELFTPP